MRRRQASNKLNQPPNFLAEAFERLKLVPPDFELRPLDEARRCLQDWLLSQRPPKGAPKEDRAKIAPSRFQAIAEETEFDSAPAEVAEAKEAAELVIKELPASFRKYLRSEAHRASEAHTLLQMTIAYENFRWLRETLRWIAKTPHRLSAVPSDQAPRFRLERATTPVPAVMSIDADGKLEIELAPFYKGLAEIEAARIRECQNPRCRQLFWAGRIDKTGCSESCQQAIRDRRYYHPKGKGKRLERRRQQAPPAQGKITRVRNALAQGRALTREQISKQTKLSLSDVSYAIGELNKQDDQVKSRENAAGERVFYLARSAKKGR